MKVAICGLGYVGLTSAGCLMKEGHEILGIDVSEAKIAEIRAGRSPIFEPGLEELLKQGLQEGRFHLATSIAPNALDSYEVVLICVGTPSAPDGSHNLSYIAEVTRQVALAAEHRQGTPLTVAYRSTVHPGTIEKIVKPIIDSRLRSNPGAVEIVYNPEFLRESTAIADYFSPPRVVVGTKDGKPNAAMEQLYAGINAPRFVTTWKESELTKLVDNSFHAVKIAFANEIGRVCRQLGVDTKTVHQIFIADTKLNISPYYLRPGSAFGGSCLPKDVRALTYLANQCDAHTFLVDSLIRSNEAHKRFILGLASKDLKPGAKVLLNGLAFKKNSDDLRESPFVDLAVGLLNAGFELHVYDPDVKVSALVGRNLGFAFSHLPGLDTLMVDESTALNSRYDRVVDARGNARNTPFQTDSIVDVNSL